MLSYDYVDALAERELREPERIVTDPTRTTTEQEQEQEPDVAITATRILLTAAALETIREMIEEAGLEGEGGLRLSARTGAGCAAPLEYDMTLEDAPDARDTVLSSGGIRLFLDAESAWILDGLQIDYVTSSAMGEGFAFRHPNGRSGRACR
jgi:iron-sulfur cluster assembly accessory protein